MIVAKRLSAREILDRLVGFPTVSADSNQDLVDWVRTYLDDHGVDSYLDPSPCGQKFSLFAMVGPPVPGGVILSGHSDVVPVVGQSWRTNPWQVVEHDGRLYGRGTCDMKGFLALVLAHVPTMQDANLTRPIQIAISRDEEVGCLGAPPMIARMQAMLPRASIVIVGEPTMMKLVASHKGGAGFRVRLHGHEVHSSIMHRGVSAIMSAARIIDWAAQQNDRSAAAEIAREAGAFDPPYTTYHVGRIHGGTAMNITAGTCEFDIEFRCVPSDSAKVIEAALRDTVNEVEAAMKHVHEPAGIVLKQIFDVPPLRNEADGPAQAIVRRLTGDNETGAVAYGTEAGQFQEAGYSAVVCGPGDIAVAHQADEYVSLEQFAAGDAFVRRLIDEMCHHGEQGGYNASQEPSR